MEKIFIILSIIFVLLNVPKDIRLQRVKDRSYRKFGNRILPNGDLYEQEKVFLNLLNQEMKILLKNGCSP